MIMLFHNTAAFTKRHKMLSAASIVVFLIILFGAYSQYQTDTARSLEAPAALFINANLLSPPILVNNNPFYEVKMKLGPSISPEKCCDFKTKKINFAEHRGKIIVMFINLMDYASKAGNPVRTGDTGRKTARYLKRLSTITKNSFKNVEVWYVRAQSMLPGESIASYEFMTNCLFTKNETTTGTKGDVCFDKFLIFSNTNAGKFKGNNAGLKHWISKYCPGSNLVDLDKYTEKVPVESHTWPITCIIDRNGFSRLANDDYQSPELLFNRILKFEGDNQYELKPISNLNLRKEGQSSFIEWAKE